MSEIVVASEALLTADEFVDGLVPNHHQEKGMNAPENSNLAIWKAVSTTDKAFTKAFDKGTYKGTDINPTYRAMKMTEMFGPYGSGWGLQNVQYSTFPIERGEGEIGVMCQLEVWYRDPANPKGEKAVCGPHVGVDYLIRETRSGLKFDDDAYKKAQTDAMTTAFRFLGISADVYMGLWDNSKYQTEIAQGKDMMEALEGRKATRPPVPTPGADEKRETKKQFAKGNATEPPPGWGSAPKKDGKLDVISDETRKRLIDSWGRLRTVLRLEGVPDDQIDGLIATTKERLRKAASEQLGTIESQDQHAQKVLELLDAELESVS